MEIYIYEIVFTFFVFLITAQFLFIGRDKIPFLTPLLDKISIRGMREKDERWLNEELINSNASVQMEFLKYALSVDQLPVMAYTVGQDFKITNANDMFCRKLGYNKESIVGKNIGFFLSKKSLSKIRKNEWNEFSRKDPLLKTTFEFVTSDSDHRLFEIHQSRPISLKEYEKYSTIILIDITDITNSHKKIQECEILSNFVLENIGDTILTVSDDGVILTANSTSLTMFGFSSNQLAGKPLSFLVTNDALSSEEIDNISHVSIRDLNLSTNETLFYGRKIDEYKLPISVAVKKVSTQGLDHKVVIIRDIETIIKEKHDLVKERESARKESVSKSEFLSNMSHELRTPLSSILGFSQLLLSKENGELTENQENCIDHMYSGGKHLLSIIEDVLEFSKIEAGKIEICKGPVDIGLFMQEIVESFKPIADEQHINLNLQTEEKYRQILIDSLRIKQIVANLISNGIKYNREDGNVDISWTIDNNNHLIIIVEDTGVGIEKDMIDRLFVPFERLGKKDSDIKGTGIGLSYTKRLVELMSGAIEVTSKEDWGTKFTVSIPTQWCSTSCISKPNPTKELDISDKTILYIEDNVANQKIVSMSLTGKVRSLVVCSDGISGIEKCFEIKPNIILMDIHMPGMSGIEAMEIIKADPRSKHIPIIALSAHADKKVVLDCMELGFDDYLTKPINFDVFFSTLARY